MTRDTKTLLVVFILGMFLLGVFNYALHVRFLGLTMQITTNANRPEATVEPTPEPTVEASPEGVEEDASPTPRVRGTARPTATVEASPAPTVEPAE